MEKKTIKEILKNRIVVPEIQREYVWGTNKDNAAIIRNFVLDLDKQAKADENYQLGFLYSYEHGGEQHLIDGQQRMTTIALLLFYCFCKEQYQPSEITCLRNFTYRVRVETEDYLFNLLGHYNDFINNLDLFRKEQLQNRVWYRASYDTDTTITSMINCLDTIRTCDKNSKLSLTAEWILNKLSFWTFEVAQTSQGEELYISMNSRGEALTTSELFKPRLFERSAELKSKTGLSWGKVWDNWEELLFSNRGSNSPESVSQALDTFLRCIVEIETGLPHQNINPAKDSESVNLVVVEDYFDALFLIIQSPYYAGEAAGLYSTEQSLLVLKILLAIIRWGESTFEVERIYPVIKNWERRRLLKNEGVLKTIFGFMHQAGPKKGWIDYVLSLVDASKEPRFRTIDGVLNNHEWIKLLRYQTFKDTSLEEAYHSAETNPILNGYIRAIWYEAFESGFEWASDSVDTFKKRYEIFRGLFADNHIKVNLSVKPEHNVIDNSVITRAMLAVKPFMVWVSGQNYAFGWKGGRNYWKDIANNQEAAKIISRLIDRAYSGNDYSESGLLDALLGIIEEAKTKYGQGNALYYIINYPAALKARWEGHNVISFSGNWENFDIWILEKDNAHSYYHNLFINLLHFLNQGNECIEKHHAADLVINNGLQIKCSYLQGWDVGYKDWKGDIEELKEALSSWAKEHGYTVIDNETTRKLKQYYIPRGDNEQMKLGQDILDFICTFDS